ncbi:uncharacterized protein [Anabrus simplex]|uniref:uncharacterized protein n=1 Tax=Anabrus simplex TaxID=316456 RepID=UPI0035A3999A
MLIWINFCRLQKLVGISSKFINTPKRFSMYFTGEDNKFSKMNYHVVDLRSDTLTKPTPLMRKAMFEADVGDDVYGEDPTVNALEEMSASLLGKEAALYVSSGTMGNLIAIMVHCNQRGSEIILGDKTHIFKYEQGGPAQIAGVQVCTIPNKPDGTFDLDEMENHIREDDDHEPRTALVCVENTHNLNGGKVLPLDWLDELAQRTKKLGIPLHMDGARLFNAAVYLNVPASRIVQDFASVSFCLSKGLGAPVGSILAGTKPFIKQARRLRKALGGGMRQAGVIAAAGIVALEHRHRLAEDHVRAVKIAKAIAEAENKYVTVDMQNLQTNILLINVDANRVSAEEFCKRLEMVTKEEETLAATHANKGTIVKVWHTNKSCVRLVTHEGISDADVQAVITKLKFVLNEYK